MEGVVHSGWLVKSPPEKRIFKAKWRQRWFVLRHSGLIPGQFILEYFLDNGCKKLKGRIDLDQCEQVDAGLTFESKKTSYQYMFDIRTPKRVYYLVAETEAEMNKWVECICSVCGLKIHVDEDFLLPQGNQFTTPVAPTNLTEAKSSSNPYIPISECHTGKPVLNEYLSSNENLSDLPKEPPPLPPLQSASLSSLDHVALSDEFYDHPKPLKQSNLDLDRENNKENVTNVPAHLGPGFTPASQTDFFSTLPPPWKLSLDDSVPLNASTVPRSKPSSKNLMQAEYDVVPSFHEPVKAAKTHCSVQNLANHFEKLSAKSLSVSPSSSPGADSGGSGGVIPPRPPKPSKMRDRSCYENFKLPLLAQKEDKNVPPPTKEPQSVSSNDLSPSTKVPVQTSISVEGSMDDTYDFPRFRNEENINANVPPASGCGTTGRQRRHAYTNAPPGLFNSKDLIFNYECRPGLLNTDAYLSNGMVRDGDAITPPSPSAIGAYANIPTSPTSFQSDLPPAVNRELKPKRVLSSEERGSFNILTLEPPPGCRARSKTNEADFRQPRSPHSPTPSPNLSSVPPLPNRFRAQPEMTTTSDDEPSSSSSSRRNSSTDDQARQPFPAASKKDEIQYLDLDLDSEPSPSPKSPERMSASTVYKKVDFLKTKAFNEMRQNVEETYRKSQ